MSITTKPFGQLPCGQAVTQYTMTNASGASVSVIDFGGILTNIFVPDREGNLAVFDLHIHIHAAVVTHRIRGVSLSQRAAGCHVQQHRGHQQNTDDLLHAFFLPFCRQIAGNEL